ncbi:MAG: L,D-transpeptidase [Solirubrobacteraceae bacterium]
MLLRFRRLALALLVVLLAPAAVAVASHRSMARTPSTGIGLPSPTPRSGPPNLLSPAQGSLRLYLPDVFFVHHEAVTVPRRGLHVDGVQRPYVPGQWVTVRAFIGGRLFRSDRLRIRPSRNRAYGHFSERLSSPGVGEVRILVRHARTPALGAFTAQRRFATLEKQIRFGSTGRMVQLVQQRLAALHLYIPQSGVYDQGTGLAVDAYHRLLHAGTSQSLDGRTISFILDGFGAFKVRNPREGTHAEGNLSEQLLALISRGRVRQIYPISSGKPSTPTVLGHFRVYRRVPGYLPDGMYDSAFFYGGYAIHGFDPAPDYPASHGCMRLPIADAGAVYNWLNFGDAVDVYY